MTAIPNIDLVANAVILISHFNDNIPSMHIDIQTESSKYLKDVTQTALIHSESVEAKQKSGIGYLPLDELKWYCDVYRHIYNNKSIKRKLKGKQETKDALDNLYDVLTFDYVGFIETNMDELNKYIILAKLCEIDIQIGKFLSYVMCVPQTRSVKYFLSGQSARIRKIISDNEYVRL